LEERRAVAGKTLTSLICPVATFRFPSLTFPLCFPNRPQGKKILCYEEGGSNGGQRSECRSTVGLVTVSPAGSDVTGSNGFPFVEVWCVPLLGDRSSEPFAYTRDVVCAAFFRPIILGRNGVAFLPLLSFLTWKQSTLHLIVENIGFDEGYGHLLRRGGKLANATVELPPDAFENDAPGPNLFMGSSPGAILICFEEIITVVLRRQGLIYAFSYEKGDLSLLGSKNVGHFIVDGTVRAGKAEGEIDIVLLLCDPANAQDGRIGLCQISRVGFML
jgi:hypothetical protein